MWMDQDFENCMEPSAHVPKKIDWQKYLQGKYITMPGALSQ
jgi:hypothetical protein